MSIDISTDATTEKITQKSLCLHHSEDIVH
jgi:hypothetical protein